MIYEFFKFFPKLLWDKYGEIIEYFWSEELLENGILLEIGF